VENNAVTESSKPREANEGNDSRDQSPPSEEHSEPGSESEDNNDRSTDGRKSRSQSKDLEAGEIDTSAPPLPNEPLPDTAATTTTASDAPSLPSEPFPGQQPQQTEPEDDGWEPQWNPNDNSWWFYNRFTGVWQQENPRVPGATTATTTVPAAPAPAPAPVLPVPDAAGLLISHPESVAGGYNPAIHGDYDENAWYAQAARAQEAAPTYLYPVPTAGAEGEEYASEAYFNRSTGQWQRPEQGAERHTDEAKSKRQLNVYFDVDAAANMHDGRSLKAERSGKKPTKSELKAFKEKRRAKKEEKRRAWLRD
ncbi:hypothetical protein QBC46DRAFT_237090, partial [Diplogelasinospora grovesii]